MYSVVIVKGHCCTVCIFCTVCGVLIHFHAVAPDKLNKQISWKYNIKNRTQVVSLNVHVKGNSETAVSCLYADCCE